MTSQSQVAVTLPLPSRKDFSAYVEKMVISQEKLSSSTSAQPLFVPVPKELMERAMLRPSLLFNICVACNVCGRWTPCEPLDAIPSASNPTPSRLRNSLAFVFSRRPIRKQSFSRNSNGIPVPDVAAESPIIGVLTKKWFIPNPSTYCCCWPCCHEGADSEYAEVIDPYNTCADGVVVVDEEEEPLTRRRSSLVTKSGAGSLRSKITLFAKCNLCLKWRAVRRPHPNASEGFCCALSPYADTRSCHVPQNCSPSDLNPIRDDVLRKFVKKPRHVVAYLDPKKCAQRGAKWTDAIKSNAQKKISAAANVSLPSTQVVDSHAAPAPTTTDEPKAASKRLGRPPKLRTESQEEAQVQAAAQSTNGVSNSTPKPKAPNTGMPTLNGEEPSKPPRGVSSSGEGATLVTTMVATPSSEPNAVLKQILKAEPAKRAPKPKAEELAMPPPVVTSEATTKSDEAKRVLKPRAESNKSKDEPTSKRSTHETTLSHLLFDEAVEPQHDARKRSRGTSAESGTLTLRRQSSRQAAVIVKQEEFDDAFDAPDDSNADVVLWVQCDECGKWRVVDQKDHDDAQMMDKWYCRFRRCLPDTTCEDPDEVRRQKGISKRIAQWKARKK